MAEIGPVFVEETRGKTLIVTPQENLMEFEFDRIELAAASVLRELETGQIRNLVIDFQKSSYFGSTALGFFVKLWKRVRSGGGKMAVCNVTPHEKEVLELTHLDRAWPICSTLDEAIAAVES